MLHLRPCLPLACLLAATAAAISAAEIVPVTRLTYRHIGPIHFDGRDPLEGLEGPALEMAKDQLANPVETFDGLVTLPWVGGTIFKATWPPQGYVETTTDETRQVLGKEMKVRHLVWKKGGKGFANHDAEAFHVYTCARIPTPLYQLAVSDGPDITLPPGTVAWTILPAKPDPQEPAFKARDRCTIEGELLAEESLTLKDGTAVPCYRFISIHTFRNLVQQRTFWLSEKIPGGLVGKEMTATGLGDDGRRLCARQGMMLETVGTVPDPEDLFPVVDHGCAFSPPPAPWKKVATQAMVPLKRSPGFDDPPDKKVVFNEKVEPGGKELARYELAGADGALRRILTVESVALPEGTTAEQWFRDISGNGTWYGSCFSPREHMAGQNVGSHDHWPAHQGWTRALFKLGSDGKGTAFLVCLWMKDLKEHAAGDEADEKVLTDILASWRWLKGE